jgi:glycosyltransferase involved in cell wall biosynthesis
MSASGSSVAAHTRAPCASSQRASGCRIGSKSSPFHPRSALSEYETQPLAALEALSAGCRLVVADTPGLRQLAAQGLARAVELDSPPADVAAAILAELDSPPLPEPPPLPTWDDCANALANLYRSVAAR